MIKIADVLSMLCPNGEWVVYGNNYSDIVWVDGVPKITEFELEEGKEKYATWKAEQDAQIIAKKAAAEAKLAALGLTADDLKALGLGGN